MLPTTSPSSPAPPPAVSDRPPPPWARWIRWPLLVVREGLCSLATLTWPASCPACGAGVHDPGLCPACAAVAIPRHGPRCACCDHDLPVNAPQHRCGRCLARTPAFERAFGLFDYSGPVGAAIRLAKYGRRAEILDQLGRFWLSGLPEALLQSPPELVVPVPLHWRRLHHRGFSPPLVLADQVARALDRPCAGRALRRVRSTRPQAGLPEVGRRANLRGAIRARGPLPADVLLIDDVFTTGATAHACAQALRRAGACRVRVLALAQVGRTPTDPQRAAAVSESGDA